MVKHSLFAIAVGVTLFVPRGSSPPDPLSLREGGGAASSPSPERRAGEARGAGGTPPPEPPRPDFQRDLWQNLNGPWQFQFDAPDSGEARGWSRGELPSARTIVVPFPWGSPLSGVPDSAVIAWYARSIAVPAAWAGRRVFLVIGA